MRNTHLFFRFGLLLSALMVITAGCQKLIDYIHLPGQGNTAYTNCSIQSVTVLQGADTVLYTFSYNKAGDPTSIRSNYHNTGNPDVFFLYDGQHRLSQVTRQFDTMAYYTWDKFFYNVKGQIIRDTLYGYGYMSSTGPLPSDRFICILFEYDAEGRIVKEIDSSFISGRFLLTYSRGFKYDANGNLDPYGDGSQISAYDKKLSILRTHKIWMFLCCNYSINNGFTAANYNEQGLPLQFASRGVTNLAGIVPVYGPTTVVYNCK